MPPHRRVTLFGVAIDAVDVQQAVDCALGWATTATPPPCRFIVTPNVDHIIGLQRNQAFQNAYRQAALVIADGTPLVWMARLVGDPLPARIAGPDFVTALLDQAPARGPLTLVIIGGTAAITEAAARAIEARAPPLRVLACLSPPREFAEDHPASAGIVQTINELEPDILLIGLGAPKQELWIARHAPLLRARLAICVGGTVDLLAGAQTRAPLWMQRSGLEWIYRMTRDPRRLCGRYARGLMIFPWLCCRELLKQR